MMFAFAWVKIDVILVECVAREGRQTRAGKKGLVAV
jgi:hypothetical protein